MPNSSSMESLTIVKASAGSGKTHRLTLELLTLLFSDPFAYQKILAVTFTNRATAEMKERVMTVLETIALENNNEEVKDFIDHLLKVYPHFDSASLANMAKTVYANILHDYSRLSIATIDKFVLKVIRGLTHELGIDHHFQIELNTDKILTHISQSMYDHLDSDPLLLDWFLDIALAHLGEGKSWDFRQSLESFAKNILFTEGFGQFEQRFHELRQPEILARLQKLVKQAHEEYEQELNSWTSEMQEICQISKVSPQVLTRAKSNRFRKFWEKQPRLTKDDYETYFDKTLILGIEKLQSALFKKADLSLPEHQELIQNIWSLWEERMTSLMEKRKAKQWADILNQSNQFLRLCIELSKHLAVYRAEHGVLLNADATQLLAEMSKDHRENPSFIWEKMGQRYQYFLIDEFQDTSHQQWENFLPLLDHAIATNERIDLKHLIVGDVKQSIYRWRGGDWNLLEHQVAKDIGTHNVRIETLKYNYRSQAEIIHFNNRLFAFLPKVMQEDLNSRAKDLLSSEAYQTIWLKKGYHQSIKEIYSEETTHQLVPEWRKEGLGKIDIIPIPVVHNRSRFSTHKEDIFRLVTEQLNEWLVEKKLYQAHQIGILVRSNREAKELIAFIKQHNNNEYQLISAEAFYLKEYVLIQLIIKILYFFKEYPQQHPLDLVNIVQYHQHLKTLDPPNWSPQQLEELSHMKIQEAHAYLPSLFCDQIEELSVLPTMELVEQLIDIFEWGQQLEHIPYLLAFREEIAKASYQEGAAIDQFLNYWEMEQDNAKLPEGSAGNFIEVVTLHKSKGLAYDVVMLPTLNWNMIQSGGWNKSYNWWKAQPPVQELGVFPIEFHLDHTAFFEEEMAEEMLMQYMDALNELYVAMTRAKNHLVLYLLQEGPSNKGVSKESMIISDYINLFILDQLNPPGSESYLPFNEKTSWGTMVTSSEKKLLEEDSTIALEKYPVMHHFNLAFTNKEILELEVLNQLPAQQIGVWMHQMLEWYFMGEDAIVLLEQALAHRKILPDMKAYIQTLYQKTIENAALQIFNHMEGYEILLEQDIIHPKKEIYRPDILWVKESTHEAIVLDFKFTKKRAKKHYHQITKYKSMLLEMGYQQVDAYLFYGLEEDSLIQIS